MRPYRVQAERPAVEEVREVSPDEWLARMRKRERTIERVRDVLGAGAMALIVGVGTVASVVGIGFVAGSACDGLERAHTCQEAGGVPYRGDCLQRLPGVVRP